VTDPHGGRSWPSPPSAGRPPPARHIGRPPRWAAVGLPVVLAALIAVVLAAYLVVDGRESDGTVPIATGAPGSAVPSALAGEWSGDGSLTECAGFDKGCPEVRTVTLTIDCSDAPCTVTPFDPSYGRPSLRFEDGSYLAAGPVPAAVAPTCGGAPTSSALWRLRLTVENGRLRGSYAESTVQGFDCGATHLGWEVTFDRR